MSNIQCRRRAEDGEKPAIDITQRHRTKLISPRVRRVNKLETQHEELQFIEWEDSLKQADKVCTNAVEEEEKEPQRS